MTEERDLRLRGVALPNALLRIALGMNICLHASRVGLSASGTSPSPAAHVPEDPPARVVRLQLRLRAAYCRGVSWLLRAVRFPDQTRFDFGLRPHARFDVWVYFATRLADGRNTTYVFYGLFSFTRRNAS